MIKRVLLLMFLATAGIAPLSAQIDALNGICFSGGRSAVVNGLNSSNKLDGIIPSCTVTVYLTGTTNLATIYRDSLSTPLSNPFTADNLSAAAPGKWLFFATTGVGYDVTMSGGIPPLTYLLPVTLTDLKVGGGGGGAGVTNVSCDPVMGNLLGCAVTNPGTTPGLHWTLNNQAATTLYGNFTGSSRGPFFGVYSCTGLLTCTFDQPSNTLTLNVPNTSSLSITTTTPIQVNGGNGPVASGTANISCPTCGQANIQMAPPGPIDAHHVVIYPTGVTTSNVSAATYATLTGSVSTVGPACAGSRITSATWTYTGALAAQAPWINAANVSAVSMFAYVGTSATSVYVPFCGGPNGYFAPATTVTGASTTLINTNSFFDTTLYNNATALSGAGINSTSTFAQLAYSGGSTASSTMTVPLVGLYVTDLVDTGPTPGAVINVTPPLQIQTDTNNVTTLSLSKVFPQIIGTFGVASLPAAALNPNKVAIVTDSTDCVNHVGTFQYTLCGTYQTGGVDFPWFWAPVTTGGGTSGTYFVETITCTTTCTLSHTPTTFLSLARNGLVQYQTTDFTQSGVTITLTDAAVGGDTFYAQYYY